MGRRITPLCYRGKKSRCGGRRGQTAWQKLTAMSWVFTRVVLGDPKMRPHSINGRCEAGCYNPSPPELETVQAS